MTDSADRREPSSPSFGVSMARAGAVALLLIFAVGGAYLLFRNPPAAAYPEDSGRTAGKTDASVDGKTAEAKRPKVPENPFPKRFPAPGLDGGTEWLNTSGEITLKDVRGKIVLLDFWTYCCINCMHVLPDLKFLERKYANQIVVIGVHSAKFDNERRSENIRKAIVRYDIEHPVVNDSRKIISRKYHFEAWPTLVVIDPEGQYCGYVSGEGNRELLDAVIKRLIAYHKAKGTLDETPVHFNLEREKRKPTPLKFPGKVLADERGGRLFVADSNHDRIVVCTLQGKLLDVIGSGAIGRKDGRYAEASFDHPHGMALVKETLYVADTENHLIRKVDLKSKTVATLAGTGEQARHREFGGRLRQTSLNSPWDLQHVNGILYICMAGPHQIWSHELRTDRIEVFSGTGREDILNGPHLAARYAQPSGIAWDGKYLYVADSEGSAIRRVDPDEKGRVETIAGTSGPPPGRSLFEFGDRDGVGSKARLKHPLGVACANRAIYVADTYNCKIRKIEMTPDGPRVSTWLGDGKRGKSLKPPRFFEPEGLSAAGGKLYIADTNNHRICVADLKTGQVRELTIAGLKPPKVLRTDDAHGAPTGRVAAARLASRLVRADNVLSIRFPVKLPADYKLNPRFPHRFRLKTNDRQSFLDEKHFRGKPSLGKDGKLLTVALPIGKVPGKATFELSVTFGYCRHGTGGLCKLKTARWLLPLEVSAKEGTTELTLNIDAEPDDAKTHSDGKGENLGAAKR